MYLRILKKDLKRKKTMNAILLVFIIFAAMFIASSVNNMFTVLTALDSYFEKADVPDYWFSTVDEQEAERFDSFAKENGYAYRKSELMQMNPKDVVVAGEEFVYGNTLCLSTLGGSKVFDRDANEVVRVNDGEIYVTAEIFDSADNNFYEGCKIVIDLEDVKKEFTLKGYVKDAMFGSSMMGMTRFLISENDYELFYHENATICYSISVYMDDSEFFEKFNDLELNLIMNADYATIKMMYVMDMLIAAVMLVVSICLILISMVILHFTISFTMREEFREIGVMKAIGISNVRIRALYIVKYLAISVIGSAAGLALSFPFSRLMLDRVSKNIILSGEAHFLLNIICAAGTAALVVLFCYLCTRKIRKFSPIDAIRNGETGERYKGKSVIHLSKLRIPAILFMAGNDILSGPRRYFSMLTIFTLGILLIIIPVNTINTLRADKLICWFNMAECDHVISQEMLFTPGKNNLETAEQNLAEVREMLGWNQIEAEVFQEMVFRVSISYGSKKTSSLAFQGIGEVTADRYSYLEGSAPQNRNEVAISYIISDRIGAKIGDDVEIKIGDEIKVYTVTAINQSMNNMGEGIRFYQGEMLDYAYAAGSFGIQIDYTDSPGRKELEKRKELLEQSYDNYIYTAGEYISYMIGDSAGQIEGVKTLILIVVLCINMLVAILMVKSFIIKEKGEIAILKAVGFQNSSLILWQTLRIGFVLLLAAIIATLLATPISGLTVEPIFRMMGAYDIEFEVAALEVYVLYPLTVLAATAFAAFLSAQGLKKISASETSNIE